MSFTLNAVAQAKGSHSNTGANDSAEPLNTTRSRSRTPGAKGGVSPTSSHHLFSREARAAPRAAPLISRLRDTAAQPLRFESSVVSFESERFYSELTSQNSERRLCQL